MHGRPAGAHVRPPFVSASERREQGLHVERPIDELDDGRDLLHVRRVGLHEDLVHRLGSAIRVAADEVGEDARRAQLIQDRVGRTEAAGLGLLHLRLVTSTRWIYA